MVRDTRRTMDAMLDKISELCTERDNALDQMLAFARAHPEHETDPHLTLATMALL